MDNQQKCALIIAEAAMLNAEIAAMQAANSQHPDSQPYGEDAFNKVIERYQPTLGYNNVMREFGQ